MPRAHNHPVDNGLELKPIFAGLGAELAQMVPTSAYIPVFYDVAAERTPDHRGYSFTAVYSREDMLFACVKVPEDAGAPWTAFDVTPAGIVAGFDNTVSMPDPGEIVKIDGSVKYRFSTPVDDLETAALKLATRVVAEVADLGSRRSTGRYRPPQAPSRQ